MSLSLSPSLSLSCSVKLSVCYGAEADCSRVPAIPKPGVCKGPGYSRVPGIPVRGYSKGSRNCCLAEEFFWRPGVPRPQNHTSLRKTDVFLALLPKEAKLNNFSFLDNVWLFGLLYLRRPRIALPEGAFWAEIWISRGFKCLPRTTFCGVLPTLCLSTL